MRVSNPEPDAMNRSIWGSWLSRQSWTAWPALVALSVLLVGVSGGCLGPGLEPPGDRDGFSGDGSGSGVPAVGGGDGDGFANDSDDLTDGTPDPNSPPGAALRADGGIAWADGGADGDAGIE